MGVGDVVGMLEHAYYSVISPEACASILWKDPTRKIEAASALQLNSENLLKYQIIDVVIKEPQGGAHQNPQEMYVQVKKFILEQWRILKDVPKELLQEQRYMKFRRMGSFKQAIEP